MRLALLVLAACVLVVGVALSGYAGVEPDRKTVATPAPSITSTAHPGTRIPESVKRVTTNLAPPTGPLGHRLEAGIFRLKEVRQGLEVVDVGSLSHSSPLDQFDRITAIDAVLRFDLVENQVDFATEAVGRLPVEMVTKVVIIKTGEVVFHNIVIGVVEMKREEYTEDIFKQRYDLVLKLVQDRSMADLYMAFQARTP
jgi:hypothetical protein